MTPDETNPRPSIIGRRSTDGDWLSVREAISMFATKEEVAAMRASITMVAGRVDGLPSRNELLARWGYDDERYKRLDDNYGKLDTKLDEIRSNQLPRWVIPALAIGVSILFSIAQIVVALHPWKP